MNELTDIIAEERYANLLINHPEKLDDSDVRTEIFTNSGIVELMEAAIALRVMGTDVNPVNIGIESGNPVMEQFAEKMLSRELAPGSGDLLQKQLTDLFIRRNASTMLNDFHQRCFDEGEDADSLVSELEGKVLDLRKAKSSGVKRGNDMRAVREAIAWRAENPGKIKGMRFGFPKMEKMLNGLQGGQLYVIGARPSVGKTALMTQMILNLVRYKRVPFAASLEMKGALLQERLLSTLSGVAMSISQDRPFTDDELRRLEAATTELETMEWYFEDSARLDIEDICSKARRLKSEKNIDAVFVDYIQIVQNKKFKPSEARLRVGENCWKLKQLAEELDVPTIVLAQVKRKENTFQRSTGESEIPEPELHDLKEAGNIEEDADAVVLLHRDQRGSAAYTKARVAKHRNGATGVIEMSFEPQTTSFKEEDYS